VHDAPVDAAEAGQRVAVNLPTLERRDLARGDVLVEAGHYPVSYRLDVRLEDDGALPAAATVHIGTKAVPARIVRDGRYAQLRLAERVVAARGDRVVLRTDTTVGGGVVLDPAPARRLDRRRLEALDGATPEEIVRTLVHQPVTGTALQARGLLGPAELARGLAAVRSAGGHYFSDEWLAELRAAVRARLAERAAARRRTSPAPPRSSASARTRRRSSSRRSRARGSPGSPTGRSPPTSRTRGGCDASATATPSRPRSTSAASSSSPRCRRSPSRRSATRSASAAGRPSSCSSATTPTG